MHFDLRGWGGACKLRPPPSPRQLFGFSCEAFRFILRGVSDVRRMLEAVQQGDPKAAEELLPLVYDELRKLAEADSVARKALATQWTTQGSGRWFQAYTLSFLAGVAESQGKSDEAETPWREALEIARAQIGEDGPHLPHFILSLSSSLKKNDKTAEARLLDEEAASSKQRAAVN